MTNRKGQKGRPNKATYEASWGERIEGAYLGKDNCLRMFGHSRPAFSITNDEQGAVHKIKRAMQTVGRYKLPLDEWPTLTPDERNIAESRHRMQTPEFTDGERETAFTIEHVHHWINQERDRIRNLILSNPQQAAIELRIPHLAHYPAVPQKPKYTLEELGPASFEKRVNPNTLQKLNPKSLKNQAAHWSEFVRIVGVQHVRDIKKETLQQYLATITQQTTRSGMRRKPKDDTKERKVLNAKQAGNLPSPVTIRAKLTAVKSILNWGKADVSEPEDAEYGRVLNLCPDVFKTRLKASAAKKTPHQKLKILTPAQFHSLLKAADLRMKTMLHCGLNFLMHIGEVSAIQFDDFDLKTRVFDSYRPKNDKPRIAHIWKRTADCMRGYLKAYPQSSPYLFTAQTGDNKGSKISETTIGVYFQGLRNSAGLPDTITWKGMRSAGYTIANQYNSYFAKIMAGHGDPNESSRYIKLSINPELIGCANAIERHYFG